jgi:ribosomal protein S12 methylthiotransferase
VLERLAAWRAICPELTIRSTFIVGFPGETDEDFDRLLEFLDDARIDRAGCFQYSPIDGAPANALPDPVEPWLAEERYERFMRLQAEISREKLEERVGRVEQVLVDEVDEEGAWARTRGDAPEIDGRIRLPRHAAVRAGEFVRVRFDAVLGDHDLEGSVVA